MFLHLKGPTDIKSTIQYLMTLFPRKLFNDTLPQIVLKHQLYSIHNDKTLVDKELVRWLFHIIEVVMSLSVYKYDKYNSLRSFVVYRINCGSEENF